MPATQKSVKRLDVRGEQCPYPMMKASEAMQKAKEGEVIEVVTDHPPALMTIPNEAIKLGWNVKIEKAGSADWKITLYREG